MNIGPKWVHMARYELTLRLERALWLPIIFKPLLTQKRVIIVIPKLSQKMWRPREARPWTSRWGIWPPWDWGRKTRFSNGMAYNSSKVSVKKTQIGFVVINFSRSIFPYRWNNFMDGKIWEFGSRQNWIFSKTIFAGFWKTWSRTKGDIFKTQFFCGNWNMGPGHFSKFSNFQNSMFQPFKKCSY